MNENMPYWSLCFWLISVNMIIFSSIYFLVNDAIPYHSLAQDNFAHAISKCWDHRCWLLCPVFSSMAESLYLLYVYTPGSLTHLLLADAMIQVLRKVSQADGNLCGPESSRFISGWDFPSLYLCVVLLIFLRKFTPISTIAGPVHVSISSLQRVPLFPV